MRKWAVRIAIALLVLVTAFGVYNEAYAQEVKLGLGYGVSHTEGWIMQEVVISDRDWYGSIARLGGDDSGSCMVQLCEALPTTWRVAAGYRADFREGLNLSPYTRMGIAYFKDAPNMVVSEHLTFDLAVGVRLYKVVDLELQHQSTAGRAYRNWGTNLITLSLVLPW